MLQVVWETAENIAKSKSSIDFFLSGCHCKTGCGTRICSCKKKRKCGPNCSCNFCKNTIQSSNNTSTCTDETDLVNPRRACARGLQYLVCLSVCLCVCVCVCVCVFSLFWHLAQSGVQTAVSATSARYGHEI